MRKAIIAGIFFFILAGLSTGAQADLSVFLGDLNQQAAADRYSYNTRLSNQFGIPLSRADSIVRSVNAPADAFMLLQLGSMTGRSFDSVFNIYKSDRKKGWGAMAQQMGIKPGSAEFHALKRGDFVFSGKRGEKGYRHHDEDWDKGKNRDKNNDQDLDRGKGKNKDKDAEMDMGADKGKGKNKNMDMEMDTAVGKGKGKGKNK